jgi:hypothetical protein
MHISQRTINLLNFLWTTFHDFFYFGVYWLFTHLGLVKRTKSTEERLTAIEKKLGCDE